MNKTSKRLILFGLETLIILAFGAVAFMAIRAEAYYYNNNYDDNGAYLRMNHDRDDEPLFVAYTKPRFVNQINQKTSITVVGSGFTPASIVLRNGASRPTTFIDSRNLMIDVYPNEVLQNEAEFFLTVFDRETGKYSNAATFTIRDNATRIATVTRTTRTTNNSSVTYSNSNSSYVYNSSSNNAIAKVTKKISDTNKNIDKDEVNKEYGELTANALNGSNSFMPSGLMQWILAIAIIFAIIFLFRHVYGEKEYMATPMKHA